MLLVTSFSNEPKKFYYAGNDQMAEAMLAVLDAGWEKVFSNWDRAISPKDLRPSFTEEDWDMATMDTTLARKLPISMQKTIEKQRNRYRSGMERLGHKVDMLNQAHALVNMPKEEALRMTMVCNFSNNRKAVIVVTEELNKMLQDNTNNGYTSFGLYEVIETEKF